MLGFLHRKKRDKDTEDFYSFFKNILGFKPRNVDLYQLAFLHKSKSKEMHHGIKLNNERLEYLGDAVLSAVVADFLFKKYPYQGEGFLTEMRSKIVSRANLNRLAQKIGLSRLIRYNRDNPGLYKSIDGDAFEALVGAIYVDKGYKHCRRFLLDNVFSRLGDIEQIAKSDKNYKSRLIEWAQKHHKEVEFRVVSEEMRKDGVFFISEVLIDGEVVGVGEGFSKRESHQKACREALKRFP